MIFVSKSDISKKKDPLLDIFTNENIPELEDFVKLGFPLKQVVRVNRDFNSKETIKEFNNQRRDFNAYDQFEIDT